MQNTNEPRPKFPHIVNMVTLACNLRCELCILSVPYYEKPFHPSLDFINSVTDRAFAIADYEIFEFNGGETLLRGDLAEIWRHALNYIDHADVFKVITNGSLLPEKSLLDVWKDFGKKFYVIIDYYGPKLSPNAEKLSAMLNGAGISHELRDMYTEGRYFGGWVDFRAPEKPLHTRAEAEALYSRCGNAQKLRHCCNIIRGIVMPCHLQFQLHDRGIVKTPKNEYVDLMDDTETIEEKRKTMAGFYELKMLTACMWCPGLDDSVPRHTPAVQMKPGEEKFMSI